MTDTLSRAQAAYITLLEAELTEIVPLAASHGWKSTRHKKGTELRAAIDDAEQENEAT